MHWDRFTFRTWAIVLLGACAGVAVVNLLYGATFSAGRFIDPDAEFRPWRGTFPIAVFVSFGMLMLAAVGWFQAADQFKDPDRRAMRFLGLFLGFMAVDEVVSIHEHLGEALAIDWVLLYSPLVLVAGLVAVWLGARRSRTELPSVLLFAAGGGAWAIAQFLEVLEWDGDDRVAHYMRYVVAEETLELLGSALFALAALRILLSGSRAR